MAGLTLTEKILSAHSGRDARAGDIGGNLKRFRVGDTQRLALELPIDDYYMGGIINKYFGQIDDPIYWAVWTNQVIP